jgi:hypothetical protein
MLLDNIHMGMKGINFKQSKDDTTHLTYTPLERNKFQAI